MLFEDKWNQDTNKYIYFYRWTKNDVTTKVCPTLRSTNHWYDEFSRNVNTFASVCVGLTEKCLRSRTHYHFCHIRLLLFNKWESIHPFPVMQIIFIGISFLFYSLTSKFVLYQASLLQFCFLRKKNNNSFFKIRPTICSKWHWLIKRAFCFTSIINWRA